MRHLETIFIAMLIIAALRFAILGLFVLFCVLLLWGVFSRPRETAGFLSFCIAGSLVQQHPWACMIALAGGIVIAAI